MAAMPGCEPLPLICLGGPTGSGKTGMAIAIARELGCEIVNTDSRQIYRDFPIITAQPGPEEQALAPHHLYGYLGLEENCNAGQWLAAACETARAILARGHIPLFTGGTGFYFQALLHGLAPIPAIDPAVHAFWGKRVEEEGPIALWRELEEIDPDYAHRLHCNDRQRIQRALEVYAATGRTFSWWHSQPMSRPNCRGPFFYVDCALGSLEQGLKERIGHMLACGAMDEAERAMRRNADPGAPGWSGIGCRECLSYLSGRITITELRASWFANTRAYAKRQLTWFHGRKEAIPIKAGAWQELCRHMRENFPSLLAYARH